MGVCIFVCTIQKVLLEALSSNFIITSNSGFIDVSGKVFSGVIIKYINTSN